MKKTAALMISILAVVVLAALSLTGCGGAPDSIVGTTWKLTGVTVNGQTVPPSLAAAGLNGDMTVTFGPDGTAEVKGGTTGSGYIQRAQRSSVMITEEGEVESSTSSPEQEASVTAVYSYENGIVTIEGDSGRIEGNRMTFEVADGMGLVFEKQ